MDKMYNLNTNMFLEDLLWTSYRYCIGRHSYVTSLANDMGDFFYDRLSSEQKQKHAEDIRKCIADNLKFGFNFKIERQYNNSTLKPLETFIEFINSMHFTMGKEFSNITKVVAYLDKDNQLKFEISKCENKKNEIPFYQHELEDFLPWMDLASLFDVKNHKKILTVEGQYYEVYESYTQETIPARKTDKSTCFQYYEAIPWQYKKIYRPVDKGVSTFFIPEEMIKKVEDWGDTLINI